LQVRTHFTYFTDDILDDHSPLNAIGIPTIDLIDFDFPAWHTAGDTTFKTPLSFVFALRALRATVELPAGITLQLTYDLGQLHVAGGIFGATPIALPITLPVADLADDPQAEVAKLVAFGKDLAERLVTRRAEDWLKSKLSSP
jgi:hypothetical protein